MKTLAWVSLVLLSAVCVYFAVLSWLSRNEPVLGLAAGRLLPCPATPNCVSSEGRDPDVEPLRISGDPAAAWARALAAVAAIGGELTATGDGYARARFRSRLFRFVDDLELRLDADAQVVHLRSASRVGRSDLGANRARVARLRARLESPQR